jgi:hypothetical protein
LTTEDGESIRAQRVVIATGIGALPPGARLEALPPGLRPTLPSTADLSRFSGKRVAVVGGGQSASIGGAALRARSRRRRSSCGRPSSAGPYGSRLHSWLHTEGNLLRRILYPPSDIGPPGLNWLVDTPDLFRLLPAALHARLARRAIRPAGAGWLRPRLDGGRITTGRVITSAGPIGRQVCLGLDDGTERRVDHVLLATGYRVDVSRCAFSSRRSCCARCASSAATPC